MSKRDRQGAILEIVRNRHVTSQEALREFLSERGIDVTQATLSRDVRELRLVKVPQAGGSSHYTLPEEWENTPPHRAGGPAPRSRDGEGDLGPAYKLHENALHQCSCPLVGPQDNPRTAAQIRKMIDRFKVLTGPGGEVLAAGGLRLYDAGAAKIVGLVVHPRLQGSGAVDPS